MGAVAFFGLELRLCEISSFALYVCTDGSARTRREHRTAMKKRPRCGDKPMIEACGPVQIKKRRGVLHRCNKSHEQHSGNAGGHRSSVLAELVCERGALQLDADVLFTVDSRHVKGLIEEIFTARENRVLATLLGHVWKVTKKGYNSTFDGYVATRAIWETASLIASQTRAHAGSPSIDGGHGAHCMDGMKRDCFIKKIVSIE